MKYTAKLSKHILSSSKFCIYHITTEADTLADLNAQIITAKNNGFALDSVTNNDNGTRTY